MTVHVAREIIGQMLRAGAILIGWALFASTILLLPPVGGAAWALALSALLVAVHVGLPSRRGQGSKLVALRACALPDARRWIVTTFVLMPPLATSLVVAHSSIFPEFDTPTDPFITYAEKGGGWVAVGILVVLFGPVLEEFVFRGWIQKTLESRLSPAPAISITAMLYAGVHGSAERLPLFFGLGALFGWAVWRTGSIWAGILLHACYNASLLVVSELQTRNVGPFSVQMDVQGVSLILLLSACTVSAVNLVMLLGRSPRTTGGT